MAERAPVDRKGDKHRPTRLLWAILGTVGIWVAGTAPLSAEGPDEPQDPPDVQTLREEVARLRAEVGQLRNRQIDPDAGQHVSARPTSQHVAAEEATRPADPFGEPLWPVPQPGLHRARDVPEPIEYPTVDVTGFFHLQAGWFDQDDTNGQTVGDVENSLGFRRTRLAATGNVTEDISYILEFDFAQTQPRFVDVWMEFDNALDTADVRIGRFRQPFGMAALTSIRELPFLERALPFALVPFRQTGVMVSDQIDDGRFTWAVSGYRFPSDAFGNVFGDSGWGMASRVTFLPVDEGDGEFLLHFGADHSVNDPARDAVGFASPPEFVASENTAIGPQSLLHLPLTAVPPFVDTGAIPADDTNLFNVEAAAAQGPLALQSEARWVVVDRLGGSTAVFPGLYAQARYVLTGETIPYDRKLGVFGRIVPDDPVRFGPGGGPGAWEVAFRWSYLDFNEPDLQGPGRRLNDVTLGVNWYLNRFVKFQFNYIHAFLDDPLVGDSDADIFAIQGQLGF